MIVNVHNCSKPHKNNNIALSIHHFSKISRKRKREPKKRKRNVAKFKRQAGEAYTSTRTGKSVSGRTVKKIKDGNKCRFNCLKIIS